MNAPEPNSWPRRVAIIGVGLLGGSVALSLRRLPYGIHLVGYARDRRKGDQLVETGVVNEATNVLDDACRDCDVIVVCTPVDRLAEIVISAAAASPPDCLITDVGSTKAKIVSAVAQDPTAAKKFVAAHPIAGSEKSGAQHAKSDLFDEKMVVITPDSGTEAKLTSRATDFWTLVGGRTIAMSAAEHDVHLAAVSHVPHLVSALVAKMVDSDAISLVGSGWRDITRVAAGDPEMWTAICAANRDAIVSQLDRCSSELDDLRSIIQSGDNEALMTWLAKAKEAKQRTR